MKVRILSRIVGSSSLILLLTACQPHSQRQMIKSDVLALSTRVNQLNRRMAQLEKQVKRWIYKLNEVEKNSQQTRADQSVTLEDIRTELTTLNGSLDVLRHDSDQAGKSSQKFRENFDSRLTELEKKLSNEPRTLGRLSSKPKKSTKPRTKKKAGGNDITQYNKTLRILRGEKEYDVAIRQFRSFIRDYPKSSLRASAQYWIGEGYFAKGDFARAISEFQEVIDKYPKSKKKCGRESG